MVENALQIANLHEDWSDLPLPTNLPKANEDNPNLHLLLVRLNILVAHKAAIEDFSENIHTTQSKMDMASLEVIGKGLAIPFLPECVVEEQLASHSYRMWCLKNIDLLAPISLSMWKIWVDISDSKSIACKE